MRNAYDIGRLSIKIDNSELSFTLTENSKQTGI